MTPLNIQVIFFITVAFIIFSGATLYCLSCQDKKIAELKLDIATLKTIQAKHHERLEILREVTDLGSGYFKSLFEMQGSTSTLLRDIFREKLGPNKKEGEG